jgi:acetylornithine deacetylase
MTPKGEAPGGAKSARALRGRGEAARPPLRGERSFGDEAVELLARLVRTPSPSGQEGAAAALLAGWAAARGLAVERDDACVRILVAGAAPGPTLALASHLDTVPAGEGWTVDPLGAEVRGGRLYGRGASDAKASVAAMAAAAAALAAAGGPTRGTLLVIASYAEETRDTTMPETLRRLGSLPDAAIVGEPTGLDPCVAQRGQLLLRAVWEGEQVHAGWASEREAPPVNAILRAARDLGAVAALRPGRRHARLGDVAITPTMISGGIARNTTPPRCEAVLDVRSTPTWSHAELTALIAGALSAGRVEVISDRLVPAETPAGSRLLAAVRRVAPAAREITSPTCSDWVFLRGADAVKLGPGSSRVSHTADEWVELEQVRAAVDVYAGAAREYLS